MHLIYCVPFNVMITLVSNGHIMRSNQLGGCSLSFRKLSVLRLLGTYSLHIASLFFSNWNAKFSIKPVGRSHHWRIPAPKQRTNEQNYGGNLYKRDSLVDMPQQGQYLEGSLVPNALQQMTALSPYLLLLLSIAQAECSKRRAWDGSLPFQDPKKGQQCSGSKRE